MAPQTPTLFVENIADTVSMYPTGTLSADAETTSREAYRVIDGRQDRSWWQPPSAAANHSLQVDAGSGVSIANDYVFFGRGHNLWGRTVTIKSATDGVTFSTTVTSLVVPSLVSGAFPIGGDPTTGWCVTEEGAIYTLFSGAAAKRGWQALFPDNFQPVVPTWMIGRRTQLLNFSRIKDEDAGNRTEIQETSKAGYLGRDRRYSWRTFALDLNYIGATEYDNTIRTVVRGWMFDLDQPWVGIMDYGTKPERAWLYRWDGNAFSAATSRVYRGLQIRGREVDSLIR